MMCFNASSLSSFSHCDLHCSKKERKIDGNIIILFVELYYIKKMTMMCWSFSLLWSSSSSSSHSELCYSHKKNQQCGGIIVVLFTCKLHKNNNIATKKPKKVLTKETDPWGDSFIPSMKSKNRIFLDGALVGAGSLKPLLPSNFKCNLC